MKILKKLMVLLMAALALSTLFACDYIESALKGGDSDSGSQTYTVQQSDDDVAMLEAKGYTCSYYKNDLEVMEDSIHADSGTVKAWVYAYNSDGDGVQIYYLATAKDAKNCYNKINDIAKSAYKVKGNKLLYNDTTGLFD